MKNSTDASFVLEFATMSNYYVLSGCVRLAKWLIDPVGTQVLLETCVRASIQK